MLHDLTLRGCICPSGRSGELMACGASCIWSNDALAKLAGAWLSLSCMCKNQADQAFKANVSQTAQVASATAILLGRVCVLRSLAHWVYPVASLPTFETQSVICIPKPSQLVIPWETGRCCYCLSFKLLGSVIEQHAEKNRMCMKSLALLSI